MPIIYITIHFIYKTIKYIVKYWYINISLHAILHISFLWSLTFILFVFKYACNRKEGKM